MKLHGETSGTGPDLVLLHGWGMNNAVWLSVLPDLALRYRVTMIELPGHGGSPYDPMQANLDDWVAACLDAAPERADWIGWSLGGQIAQRAALIAPGRIGRLMLVCSSPRFVQGRDWPHAMLANTLHQFAVALKRDHQQTLARFLSLQVQGDDQARETLRRLRKEVVRHSAPDPDALEHGLQLLATVDLRAQLNRLQCPSFWVLGERDKLVPGSVARDLRGLVTAGVGIECLRGCAHAPFISHPAASLKLIEDFFGNGDE